MASPVRPPLSPLSTSREATPSSSSSHSQQGKSDTTGSIVMTDLSSQGVALSPAALGGLGASAQGQSQEDVERFLKRMDMEKTMHALQQRLELASVKATKGWSDMSIGEIEERLPPGPSKRRSVAPPSPISTTHPHSPVSATQHVPYEPPSPSRPWQLIDVLWQPLPPPSHGRYPMSPSSPRKRSRDGQQSPSHYPSPHHHRRASSAAINGYAYHPASPIRNLREESTQKKKRSQSHSAHHRVSTQDVDAANALTSMLSAASSPVSTSTPRMHAPPLPATGSHSLPLPGMEEFPYVRPRSHSIDSPEKRRRSRDEETETVVEGRGEEDKNAAELMMFLAHSPSPMKTPARNAVSPSRAAGGVARVLFADREEGKVKEHSNLGLAPPITSESLEVERAAG